METNQINEPEVDLRGLIGRLKNEDARNQRLTSTFKWLMFIMAPLYLLIAFAGLFDDSPWYEGIGFFFFALAFLVFALMFRKYNREYSSVDYGIPVVEMLEKAVKRYEFWQRKTGLVLFPVILVDLGLSFSSFGHFFSTEMEPVNRILLIQAAYIPMMTISITIGYFIWRRRQKPILDQAKELLQEIRS